MRVLYLANRVPWFGAHTGYEQLPYYLKSTGLESETITPGDGLLSRVAGKMVSLMRGHGKISQSDAAARARLELGLRTQPDAVGHLLYGEEHLPFWRDAASAARSRCVVTVHQPLAQLGEAKAEALAACPHVIVLWQREMEAFRARMKGGTLDFIPHGADIEFFRPATKSPERGGPIRLLYAGVHLRNVAMLTRLICRLNKDSGNFRFDLLVPEHRRGEPAWAELRGEPNLIWHAGLNDEELRALYQSAHLLLLPMNDSGANTAVVEALSCGLPVVTTDVGGIRDYGGGTVFPVVENNDDEGILTVIEKYVTESDWRDETGRRCRAFAEETLAWPLIAARHAEVYRRVRG